MKTGLVKILAFSAFFGTSLSHADTGSATVHVLAPDYTVEDRNTVSFGHIAAAEGSCVMGPDGTLTDNSITSAFCNLGGTVEPGLIRVSGLLNEEVEVTVVETGSLGVRFAPRVVSVDGLGSSNTGLYTLSEAEGTGGYLDITVVGTISIPDIENLRARGDIGMNYTVNVNKN